MGQGCMEETWKRTEFQGTKKKEREDTKKRHHNSRNPQLIQFLFLLRVEFDELVYSIPSGVIDARSFWRWLLRTAL
jgi:hypothetical protein